MKNFATAFASAGTAAVETIDGLIDEQINAIATDSDTLEVWEDSPKLAARLAFAEVQRAWAQQASGGLFQGNVPNITE